MPRFETALREILENILIAPTTADRQENSKKKIILGLGFIAFSLILPRAIQPQMFVIFDELSQCILTGDTGLLLLVANKLVCYNTLRHAPVIIGAFLLGEEISSRFRWNRLVFLISLIIIPLTFRGISTIYNIQFLFSGSIYVTASISLIVYLLTIRIRTSVIKLMIITLFLFGFDWLEIVPLLARFGYRGGEIAQSIRMASRFIGADYVLNYVGLTISIMVITNASILSKVVLDSYNRMFLVSRLRNIELEALRSRSFQEVKHLVHDLKTPLATIQGLNGVISMMVDDPKVKNYTEKVSDSVEKISSMISEILYENQLSVIDVKEITDFLKTYLSLENHEARVRIELLTDQKIHANKYLLSRALINLISNGLQAIDRENGFVHVRVIGENGKVIFLVIDNGKGIPKESLQRIWELGYTEGKSTGLGLNFVKKVVHDHGGSIDIKSRVNVGTTARICLPGVEANDEKNTGC